MCNWIKNKKFQMSNVKNEEKFHLLQKLLAYKHNKVPDF